MKVQTIKRNGFVLKQTQYGSCAICKRPLTKPESVSRGMGPICAAKQARKEEATGAQQYLSDPISDGFIFRRVNGVLATNVPTLVVHHSPTGFEIGYMGSGPADLALNICELLLRRMGYRGPTMVCWDGEKCFKMAWAMHQDFKASVVATLDRDGGKIDYQAAKMWVEVWVQVAERGYEQGVLEFPSNDAISEAYTDYA